MDDYDQFTAEPLRTRTGRIRKAKKGLRVHTCGTCGKVYTRNEHLRRHQLLHSNNASSRPVLTKEESQGEISTVDDAIFDIDPGIVQDSSATSLFETSNAISLGEYADYQDYYEDDLDFADVAALLDRSTAATFGDIELNIALSNDDIEALGKNFKETLHNDFHYRRLVDSTCSLRGAMHATTDPMAQWKKLLSIYDRQSYESLRRRRSAAYRSTFSYATHAQIDAYQKVFWTKMHPHLQVFESVAAFREAMASHYPTLWLIVMALACVLSESEVDHQRADIFAEDALDSLMLDATLDSEDVPIDQQRAVVLIEVYATFFSHHPYIQFPTCLNTPSTCERILTLQRRLRHLRSALFLQPLPSSPTSPHTPLLRLLSALGSAIPLRPMLTVAGASYLNGAKVPATTYKAAQRALRRWSRLPTVSTARRLAREILDSTSQPDMLGCPWRKRAAFIACLASWAVRYAESGIEVAVVEARRLLDEGPGAGWIGADMQDTLEGLIERGEETGWF